MKPDRKTRNSKMEPTIFLIRKMWRFAKGHRHLVIIFTLLSLISNIFGLLEPLLFKNLMDSIQIDGISAENLQHILSILLGFFLLELGFWLTHGPSRVIEVVSAFKTDRNYKQYLLSGAMNLGLSWHSQRDSGDTIDKVNKASEGLNSFSSGTFMTIGTITKIIGTTIALIFFNPYIALLAFVFLVIAFFVINQFDLRLIPQYKELNLLDNKISGKVFDTLSNITTVKVLNIEDPVYKNIKTSLWTPFKLFVKNNTLGEVKWGVGGLFFRLIVVIPLAIYILYNYKNNITIEVGTVSAIYLYLFNLIEVYFAFTSSYQQIIKNKAKVMNAEEIEEEIENHEKLKKKSAPLWKEIDMKNISFKYEDSETKVNNINGVNFSFKKGDRIAVIGESGSGKSTFLKVIHGMYSNSSAQIFFDTGKSVNTNFTDLDLKTTLVPQEPEIFSSSIRENITLGVEFSDKQIFEVTDIAQFTEVIKKLPKGLESVINEKGVNLSGGQKQRLALARALIFASDDKEIILLDESTSSVDPTTENKIYRKVFDRFGKKTVIASIHKMNLLKFFDRIVVFSKGKIVDDGSFDELLERNEKFREDWEKFISQNPQI